MSASHPTIVALASAVGRGGVAVVRVSGQQVPEVAQALLGELPKPRYAWYTDFYDADKTVMDQGIALYFKGPNSFTGEDVLELHCHGGPVLVDMLIERILGLSTRLAEPGEFSLQAFLNDKMDLTQAEAISDLIQAHSKQAVRAAVSSLQGQFSDQVNELVHALIQLRLYVEAAIDFPEEEDVDFLTGSDVESRLDDLLKRVSELLAKAKQGVVLSEGLNIVLIGKPNVGKSSLLNCLTQQDTAIVTPVAGTTRDLIKERINLAGVPLHLVDTAGLRQSPDIIEQEGIRRAKEASMQADHIFYLVDAAELKNFKPDPWLLEANIPLTLIANKIDLTDEYAPGIDTHMAYPVVYLSAKNGLGIQYLEQHVLKTAGISAQFEGTFCARRRHLESLKSAADYLRTGQSQLKAHQAGELLADDLLQAQKVLSQITGQFTADDLLGEIFSSFCIGK